MVLNLLWGELAPLADSLFQEGGSRVDDAVYILQDMLINDLCYLVGPTFSERLGKGLLERWLLAYWDKLLTKDGYVEYAKSNNDSSAPSELDQDLQVMQDFRDAVASHHQERPLGNGDSDSGSADGDDDRDDDDGPSMSRVIFALNRTVQIWEYMHAMLTMEPLVDGLFLGFQNICSRDSSCPTALCELILIRRHKDVPSKTRKQVMGMFKEREIEYNKSGMLCRLRSVQNIDDNLRKGALVHLAHALHPTTPAAAAAAAAAAAVAAAAAAAAADDDEDDDDMLLCV